MSATAEGGAPAAGSKDEAAVGALLYRPEYNEEAHRLTLLGLTLAQLAAVFDVAEATIKNWMVAYPEFKAAIVDARESADGRVAASLYARATGYSHTVTKVFPAKKGDAPHIVEVEEKFPPDVAAAFIWLKNRQSRNWKDRSVTALVGDNDEPSLKIEQDTAVQAKLAALTKKLEKFAGPDDDVPPSS